MTQPHPPTVQPTFQPLVHDAIVAFSAPTQAWSSADGEIGTRPIEGVYHSDTRILSAVSLLVGGRRPESISHSSPDAFTSRFVALLRHLDDHGADPRVVLDRVRRVRAGVVTETIEISSAIDEEIHTVLRLAVTPSFDVIHDVKGGVVPVHAATAGPGVSSTATADGALFSSGGATGAVHVAGAVAGAATGAGTGTGAATDTGTDTATDTGTGAGTGAITGFPGGITAAFSAPGAEVAIGADGVTSATWRVTVPAHGSVAVEWRLDISDGTAVVDGAPTASGWSDVSARTGDARLGAWVDAALGDLEGLRMVTRARPDDVFLAAGAPWFLTLFGRDSLWAARMTLPLGTELAASTLRVLAALQGIREVADSAEQPGKIMHELRPATLVMPGEDVSLPPLYYGTVDATALWITLLHDAWKWGMADVEVEALLPHLEAALAWMRDYGDSDGDGFLEYVDTTGHGLANQGWKDSGDSIQWRDGTLADGPIALCEVQAYAYEAAVGGAAILEHFGRPGGDEWRDWAAGLKRRFAESFWIESPDGAYPAVALDAGKKRVDTVTSNIGHLLGTGILDEEGSRLVARRLVSPELNSGYGLRTMSTDSTGYWPLSYHGGSVWTHDTAIAIAGLGRAGFGAEASVLVEGLLRAAEGFRYRMPELHSGHSTEQTAEPIPYPAACRPQAWSAASAIAVLGTVLGLSPDAQGAGLTVAPLASAGALDVHGLVFTGRSFSVATDSVGRVSRNTLLAP